MKKSLLTCTLLLLTLTLAAQTYHLEAVTTIVPNERYVFLQDGDAMSNTLVNKALQTTSNYHLVSDTPIDAITTVHHSPLVPHQVYDLQGRKLHSQFSILHSQFSRGIYIVNGKLVVK